MDQLLGADKMETKTVKIHFILEREDEDFPPVSIETLNAVQLEDGGFKVMNSPFFIDSVAYGDRVNCTLDNGEYFFESVEQPNGFKAYSIIVFYEEKVEEIGQKLGSLASIVEFGEFGPFLMFALAEDDQKKLKPLLLFLRELENEELGSYAELCI